LFWHSTPPKKPVVSLFWHSTPPKRTCHQPILALHTTQKTCHQPILVLHTTQKTRHHLPTLLLVRISPPKPSACPQSLHRFPPAWGGPPPKPPFPDRSAPSPCASGFASSRYSAFAPFLLPYHLPFPSPKSSQTLKR
ncbi:hypothetical protein L6R29_20985, partial [Myxococcota bacterium]|nr:hypothetical protein [Myxococcota bacterium]